MLATATLDELIDAWRARPITELAEVIVAIARQAPAAIAPDRSSLWSAQEQWLALAREPSVAERGWLLDRIITSRGAYSLARLRRIAELPADPRDVPALLGIVAGTPHTTTPPFWTATFRLLRARADRRVLVELPALLARPAVTNFEGDLLARLRGLEARLATQAWPTATAAEATAIAAVAAHQVAVHATTIEKTIDDFLADVWATPRDDGPREVFADWLLERGEVRGELITLQISRARGHGDLQRERALLNEHARRWMGPLEPAVAEPFTFERGFLATCRVAWRTLLATPGLMTHPAWATVREYRLDPAGERPCDRWLDHMIALGAKRG